ncbi:MAG: universal stress protein [Terriglobia bacterium]|jgi:nucleotide-binding universal stress UspA family protein
MHSSLAFHPLGIFIAFVFLVSMSSILWWMLHPPPQVEAAVAKARRSISALRRIMVTTRGMRYDDRAVELACRLGQEQKSEIVATYIIEVPLTLPLGITLDQEEAKAQEAVARAVNIIKLHALPAKKNIERDREAARGILRAAKELDVDLLILSIDPHKTALKKFTGKTTERILSDAPCEVIVDHIPVSELLQITPQG